MVSNELPLFKRTDQLRPFEQLLLLHRLFCRFVTVANKVADKNHINGSINSDAVRGSEPGGTKTGLEKAREI